MRNTKLTLFLFNRLQKPKWETKSSNTDTCGRILTAIEYWN